MLLIMHAPQTIKQRLTGNNSMGQDWDLNRQVEGEGHCLINATRVAVIHQEMPCVGCVQQQSGLGVGPTLWPPEGTDTACSDWDTNFTGRKAS
jgi:hypothetical protein